MTQNSKMQRSDEDLWARLVAAGLFSGGLLLCMAFKPYWNGSFAEEAGFILLFLILSFVLALFPLVALLSCLSVGGHFWLKHDYPSAIAYFAVGIGLYFLWRGVRFVLFDWNKTKKT